MCQMPIKIQKRICYEQTHSIQARVETCEEDSLEEIQIVRPVNM